MKLTFSDLFCGIGGTRQAIERAAKKEGFDPECVFSCDYDKFCQITYEANFGEKPFGNIYEVNPEQLPAHDIMSAGFPCQPFSIAGVSKKASLGRPHGFADKTQGTLFFELARLAHTNRPRVIFLENVKNLVSHDKGKTIATIIDVLSNDLEYYVVPPRVFDARYLVPQHRERVFIIAFREKEDFANFTWPEIKDAKLALRSILEQDVDSKYTLSDKLFNSLKQHAERHKQKGHGFGLGIANLNGVSRTLSARYYKDGSEILIPQPDKNPRRLTPRECARLQGFPDSYKIPVSDTQAYKQFGNSVPIPLLEAVAHQIVKAVAHEERISKAA